MFMTHCNPISMTSGGSVGRFDMWKGACRLNECRRRKQQSNTPVTTLYLLAFPIGKGSVRHTKDWVRRHLRMIDASFSAQWLVISRHADSSLTPNVCSVSSANLDRRHSQH